MISPFIAALLGWSEQFESGRINDPYLAAGTLAPGERFAVRIGPVRRATMVVPSREPQVKSAGPTANLIATDRRLVFVLDDGDVETWSWQGEVDQLGAVPGGLGVNWIPTRPDEDGGYSLQAAVVPALVEGRRLSAEEIREVYPEFIKVVVAWRSTQPGGVAAWRSEFREKHDHTW